MLFLQVAKAAKGMSMMHKMGESANSEISEKSSSMMVIVAPLAF